VLGFEAKAFGRGW